ncbi:MAG: hypothetical protein ACP5OG_00455 [Candidatus Nanoarchaeia archaeon]
MRREFKRIIKRKLFFILAVLLINLFVLDVVYTKNVFFKELDTKKISAIENAVVYGSSSVCPSPMFYIYKDINNVHISTEPTADYVGVCLEGYFAEKIVCSDPNAEKLLSYYADSSKNSHASVPGTAGYTDLCFRSLECETKKGNENCPQGMECIITLESESNSHVGSCNFYNQETNTKICCKTTYCGNGIINNAENCDIGNDKEPGTSDDVMPTGASCVSAGYSSGTLLGCKSDCTFETKECRCDIKTSYWTKQGINEKTALYLVAKSNGSSCLKDPYIKIEFNIWEQDNKIKDTTYNINIPNKEVTGVYDSSYPDIVKAFWTAYWEPDKCSEECSDIENLEYNFTITYNGRDINPINLLTVNCTSDGCTKGEKRCNKNSIETCMEFNGCYKWINTTNCTSSAMVCLYNSPANVQCIACDDANCIVGSKQCSTNPSNIIQECKLFKNFGGGSDPNCEMYVNTLCGTDGYSGEPICNSSDNSVYKNYSTFSCIAGSGGAECKETKILTKLEKCKSSELCYNGECVKKDYLINFCSNYTNEKDCTSDAQSVGKRTVEAIKGMPGFCRTDNLVGSLDDGTSKCNLNVTSCYCKWNETENECESAFNVGKKCYDNLGKTLTEQQYEGSCVLSSTFEDNCDQGEDGNIKITWSENWVGSKTYTGVCDSKSKVTVVPCSSLTRLLFFNWINFSVSVVAIFLMYLFYNKKLLKMFINKARFY